MCTRSMRVCVASETKRVYASGWSPTSRTIGMQRMQPQGTLADDRRLARLGRLARPRRRPRPSSTSRWRTFGIDRSSSRHCSSATGCELDDADVLQLDGSRADEVVADRDRRLGDDRDGRLVEQVVRLVDRPGERALDRQHAVRHLARRPSPRSPPRTCPRRRARSRTGTAARPPRRCVRRRRPRMRPRSSPAERHVEAAACAVRLGGPLVLGPLPGNRLLAAQS